MLDSLKLSFSNIDPTLIVIGEILLLFILSRRIFYYTGRLLKKLIPVRKLYYWIFALSFLPGTIIHELSHYLFAMVLFVPVGKFELIPEQQKGSLKLGSVSFKKVDIVRSALIALAPLNIGMIILILLVHYQKNLNDTLLLRVIYYYLIFQIGNSMFLSAADLKYVIPFVILIGIVALIIFYYHIPLFNFLSPGIINIFAIKTAKILSYSLLPVIFIDGGIVIIASILKK